MGGRKLYNRSIHSQNLNADSWLVKFVNDFIPSFISLSLKGSTRTSMKLRNIITTTTTALTCCFVLSCIHFLRPLSLIYPFVCGAVLVMATREQQRRPQTLNLALELAQPITEIQLTFTCFTSCFWVWFENDKRKQEYSIIAPLNSPWAAFGVAYRPWLPRGTP